MKLARNFGIIFARFCMSAIFLASGVSKIFHWQNQESEMYRILAEWQSNISFSAPLQDFFSILIPWSPVLLIVGTLFEFAGGFLVLLGTRERFGALLLIFFLIPTTLIMHPFWFSEGLQKEVEISHFLKNLSILGGLFFLLIFGSEEKKASPSIKFG